MFTWIFWKKSLERMGKTAAQFAAGVIFADKVGPMADSISVVEAAQLDWKMVGMAAFTGAVLSLVTSTMSVSVGDSDSPSLIDETPARHAKSRE